MVNDKHRRAENTPRRVNAGNATRLDPNAEVYPEFINLSLAQQDATGEGNVSLQNHRNVVAAKKFVDANEK